MKNIKIISQFLERDLIQRSIYGIGFLFWTIIWLDDINQYASKSSTGINYCWIMVIPSLILVGQVFLNNKFLWALTVGLFGAYTLWTFWNILFLEILLDYHREFVTSSHWKQNIFLWTVIVLFLLATNWVIWKIKPNK